jgi:hypothetical protein
VVDDRALIAFTNGHCHSLASALAQELDGEIVALRKREDPFDHVLARARDGRLIDIGGAHTPGELTATGGQLIQVDVRTLEGLTAFNWSPLASDAAAPWVPAVLRHVASGAPPAEPGVFRYGFAVDDLSIHIEWSDVEGASRLTAWGRLPSTPPGVWNRCMVIRPEKNEIGERLIDFSPAEFDRLACLFERTIRHSLDTTIGYVLNPADPERPRWPPANS